MPDQEHLETRVAELENLIVKLEKRAMAADVLLAKTLGELARSTGIQIRMYAEDVGTGTAYTWQMRLVDGFTAELT